MVWEGWERGDDEEARRIGEGAVCIISSHLFLSLPSFSRVSLHTLWYFHASSLCLQIQIILPSYVLSIYKFMRWTREANYTLIISTHLHLLSLLSAHLSDFLYKRRSPHFRPSLCFRPQAVSLPAPSAPHTPTCIPAYTIEKHTKNKSWTISTLSPPLLPIIGFLDRRPKTGHLSVWKSQTILCKSSDLWTL